MNESVRIVLTENELQKVKKARHAIMNKTENKKLCPISNQIYNILDFLYRKNKDKDIAISYEQLGELMSLNKMTIFHNMKVLKEKKMIETYQAGIPKRQFFVNKYHSKKEKISK